MVLYPGTIQLWAEHLGDLEKVKLDAIKDRGLRSPAPLLVYCRGLNNYQHYGSICLRVII